jgi:hypothetical protein
MTALSIDKHTVALISIIGSSLDVLGALYLAYDLLGGEHGPLRTLTRAVTYGALFGTGYGLALGPLFGVMTGIAHGITLGWEYARASRNEPNRLWRDVVMSAIRAAGFGLGAAFLFGPRFGIAFAVLSTIGQTIAYRFGIRPSADYRPASRPRLSRFLLLAAANRTVGYAITGYLSSIVAQQREHAIAVGLKTGLAIGIVTAIAGCFTPFVEWTADRVPEKSMGVFGIALMLTGFALQSTQYWIALLDVKVR